MLQRQRERKKIRKKTKVLRLYFQSMETYLQEITNITLQIQGLEDLKNRLQEAVEDHRRLKSQFEAPTTFGENQEHDMLLILQGRLEAVKDKCPEFMTAFLEAREEQRMKDNEEGGDEDLKTVKEMKNKAIDICAEVCRFTTNLMITASRSERAVEIFRVFRSALECVEADLKVEPAVIKKFSHLMKIIDDGIEKMNRGKNKKEKKAVIEDEGKKKTKKQKTEEEEEVEEEDTTVNEAQLEGLFDKFLIAIMSLELVMKDPGVPDEKKLKGSAMELLKARVESCEKFVKDLEKEVYDFEVETTFVEEPGDLTGLQFAEKMEEEIAVVWTKLEDEPVEVEAEAEAKVDGGRTTSN